MNARMYQISTKETNFSWQYFRSIFYSFLSSISAVYISAWSHELHQIPAILCNLQYGGYFNPIYALQQFRFID
jgi:hypothetical protein